MFIILRKARGSVQKLYKLLNHDKIIVLPNHGAFKKGGLDTLP